MVLRRLGGLILLLALAACGKGAEANPAPELTRNWPAAVAGGACQLLDYDTIEDAVGTRFDTSGAGQKAETFTCAVTRAGVDYPDLTLAVTATKADKVIFVASVVPSGSSTVAELGKAAYLKKRAAAGKAGPAVEVGWLSGNQRLMVLRYTFPPKAPAADVDALAAKLVELAKVIDQTSI